MDRRLLYEYDDALGRPATRDRLLHLRSTTFLNLFIDLKQLRRQPKRTELRNGRNFTQIGSISVAGQRGKRPGLKQQS